MKKLDNKGFAITGILYTLLILFLMILLSVFSGLRAKKSMLEKSTEVLEKSFLGDATQSNAYIASVIENRVAPVKGKYVFELDSAKNLIYSLYNSSGHDDRASYVVTNKEITVTAKQDDGYIFIPARLNLTAGVNYTFSCEVDGIWGVSGDTVQTFLMLDGKYNTYYYMNSNQDFSFTPTVTGVYWVRLDVNQAGKTHHFKNLRIVDNIHKTSCYAYLDQNDMIQNGSVTFVPKDCNDYNYTFSFDNSNPEGLKMTLKQIYSFERE